MELLISVLCFLKSDFCRKATSKINRTAVILVVASCALPVVPGPGPAGPRWCGKIILCGGVRSVMGLAAAFQCVVGGGVASSSVPVGSIGARNGLTTRAPSSSGSWKSAFIVLSVV